MSDEERQQMIDDFRNWFREHKEQIQITKPEEIPQDEWDEWEN